MFNVHVAKYTNELKQRHWGGSKFHCIALQQVIHTTELTAFKGRNKNASCTDVNFFISLELNYIDLCWICRFWL